MSLLGKGRENEAISLPQGEMRGPNTRVEEQ